MSWDLDVLPEPRLPARQHLVGSGGQGGKGEVMNDSTRIAMIGLIAVAALVPWRQSAAQTANKSSGSDADALETIAVTAEKREERLQDVPMSVTALSGKFLDKLQGRSFANFAAMVPGLSLMSSGPRITQLTLRGQNAGGDRCERQRRNGTQPGTGVDLRIHSGAWADVDLDGGLHRRATDLARAGRERSVRRLAALRTQMGYVAGR